MSYLKRIHLYFIGLLSTSRIIQPFSLLICASILQLDTVSIVILWLTGRIGLMSKINGWFIVSQWLCHEPYAIALPEVIMDMCLVFISIAALLKRIQFDDRHEVITNLALICSSVLALIYLFTIVLPQKYIVDYQCPYYGQ
jgi:hypothetical protein